jgi:hypothetical protein
MNPSKAGAPANDRGSDLYATETKANLPRLRKKNISSYDKPLAHPSKKALLQMNQ